MWLLLSWTQKESLFEFAPAERREHRAQGATAATVNQKNKKEDMSYAPTPRPCRTLLTADAYAGAPGACALPGVRSAKPASPQHPVRH